MDKPVEMINPSAGREMIPAKQVKVYEARGWIRVKDYVPKPTGLGKAVARPGIMMDSKMREAMKAHKENKDAKDKAEAEAKAKKEVDEKKNETKVIQTDNEDDK